MKILVALSGSHIEPDAPVLVAATEMPWPADTQVRVLSVAETIHPVSVGMIPDALDAGDVQVTSDDDARAAASNGAAQFRNRGLTAEAISLEGDPSTEIVEHARTWGADLVVVGSHDRSGLERFFMGSVSQNVVEHSPCSVLVVKHAPTA